MLPQGGGSAKYRGRSSQRCPIEFGGGKLSSVRPCRSRTILAMPSATPNDPRPPLEPPRFRLRTLLLAMGGVCVLLAILSSLSPYGMFAGVMLVLLVIAHVVGAALGHRLRDHGDRVPASAADSSERYRPVAAAEFAPPTRLGGKRRPGRLVVAMTIAWAILGAGGGAALLVVLNGERSNLMNVSSGALAFAVLGAIWGFALASFLQEMLSALSEAHRVK